MLDIDVVSVGTGSHVSVVEPIDVVEYSGEGKTSLPFVCVRAVTVEGAFPWGYTCSMPWSTQMLYLLD